MHEYEFRLVVQSPTRFELRDISPGCVETHTVFYAKPHFRYRKRHLETKTVLDTQMVYFDRLWFKWVHSKETPYNCWSTDTHKMFLNTVGNFQCPFLIETRQRIRLDTRAQIYTFRAADGLFRLVFEWEYGVFPKRLKTILPMTSVLRRYRTLLTHFRTHQAQPYTLKETMTRKTVTCMQHTVQSDIHLIAHKWDGIFGLVYSYADAIVEKWESGINVYRKGTSLGDGIVYSAENMSDTVVLLDVYQVRGYPVAPWSRRDVFLKYLPQMKLPKGYEVQNYFVSLFQLPFPFMETDGYILHDTEKDQAFKVKQLHTLDVVYQNGYFHLPDKRYKAVESENVSNGLVYEVSLLDGKVIRPRPDRMKGNTKEQIEAIFSNGRSWKGPPFEKIPKEDNCSKNKRRRRM